MKTKTLIQELKQYQKERRINQEQLSTLLGVSKFTLNRWFRGHNDPSPVYKNLIRYFLKRYY